MYCSFMKLIRPLISLVGTLLGTLLSLTSFAQFPIDNSPIVLAQAPTTTPTKVEDVPNHDETPRQWSIHGQSTYIVQQKNNFNAPYFSPNTSLLNADQGDNDKSYTLSATLFVGTKLWKGAELYYNQEMFQGTPFSRQLVGLGSFNNGELQKGSYIPAVYYTARAFIRQTIGLGGGEEFLEDGINQIAGYADKNRLVLTYGKVASLDFFDQNTYSHDPRTQFFNFAIWSMGAYGYAADPKGFTYGVVGEWYHHDWTLRAGRLAIPVVPNTMDLDYTLSQDYTDQVEVTHQHKLWGQPGAIRALVFQQRAFMASYQDAISQYYQQPNNVAPNILTARFGEKTMWGYGLNIEQAVSQDIGVFARWSWNSGNTETQTLDVSSSISGGVSIKGSSWGRSEDTIGLGYAVSGVSSAEINYLQLGGSTAFIGDGALAYKPEQVFEAYYSAKIHKGFYMTADYQYIANPAYNSNRGPINFIGLRAHIDL